MARVQAVSTERDSVLGLDSVGFKAQNWRSERRRLKKARGRRRRKRRERRERIEAEKSHLLLLMEEFVFRLSFDTGKYG
jgi:hypothetical protein